MRRRVGIATSVVLTGGLYAQQAEEGSVYLWGLVFSAVLAYWLGYGVVAGIELLRNADSTTRSGRRAKQASDAVVSSGAAEMSFKDRVAALERLAGLHEKGLLSGDEFAAAKAELLPEIGEREAEEAGSPGSRSKPMDAASFGEKEATFFADENGTKAGLGESESTGVSHPRQGLAVRLNLGQLAVMPAWVRFSFWINSFLVLGSVISASMTIVSFEIFTDRQESSTYEFLWVVSESVMVALIFPCVLVAVLTFPFLASWLSMEEERTGLSEDEARPLWERLVKWSGFGFLAFGAFLVSTHGLEVSRCCSGATSVSTYRGWHAGISAGLLFGLVPWHALTVVRLLALANWSERATN